MVFFWFGLRTQFFWHQNYPATGFCSRYPQAMQVRCQVCAFCCWPGTRANGHMTRMIIHQWIRPGFRHLHVWTSAGQFDPHAKEFAARNRLNRLDHGEEVVWKCESSTWSTYLWDPLRLLTSKMDIWLLLLATALAPLSFEWTNLAVSCQRLLLSTDSNLVASSASLSSLYFTAENT